MDEMSNAELTELIDSLCQSKIDEFKMLGYEQITSNELWDCLNSKYEKQGMPRLYALVNDILSMKPNQLMNYLTMSSYKEAEKW